MVGYGPSIEILGRGTLGKEATEPDIAKVLAACSDWATEFEIIKSTGLGRGRVNRALALAGDRLERAARAHNTCYNVWIWRRV